MIKVFCICISVSLANIVSAASLAAETVIAAQGIKAISNEPVSGVVYLSQTANAVLDPGTWVMVSTALVFFIASSMGRRVQS